MVLNLNLHPVPESDLYNTTNRYNDTNMVSKSEAVNRSVFSDCSEDAKNKIVDLLREDKFSEGDVVVQQGDQTGRLSIISTGKFSVTMSGSAGEEVQVDVLKTGDFIGLGSLFCGTPHSATVTASEPAVNYSLGDTDFKKLLQEDVSVSLAMLGYMQNIARRDRKGRQMGSDAESGATRIALFDAKSYDRETFDKENEKYNFEITYFETRLGPDTAALAAGYDVVVVFVNDDVSDKTVRALSRNGVKMVANRCAGFDRVDLKVADAMGIPVVRVPAYSPYAVAEHAVALCQTLNRKLHKAYNRIREGDFSLGGLVGYDLHGRTCGVIGTGKIGQCLIDIMIGYGMKIAAYDIYINKTYEAKPEVTYMSLDEVLACSDVISIHSPLLPSTHHMINAETIAKMKKGVTIINCARGGLIDTDALLDGLKNGQVGGAGLDVYEGEQGYFFENWSGRVIQDDRLANLVSNTNVLITSHQAFLTIDALEAIARVTLSNVNEMFNEGKNGAELTNYVAPPPSK
ncbi:hypothetical protein SARC_01855 [Sphaeroforma arctica JP610]|uniref:Cyclic nucleotide-binding domain-containing protein n=1 Tax=Sphaeroforma arctica JP610 TaxID=667725 RepID=A0A0L0GAP0_9EUKA|nr:hypothetical protein SARC_01855 [Sphaeroforma arctica JP610]KNC85979.1 hypothetical protein SARC_01855 [Sphaeroforma arctica JP610]|eukprot:XP_014159881.1 hypothetical protein SARC_01855 [Sphaeroforma arctica JP610]